jgi:hypothetical protein
MSCTGEKHRCLSIEKERKKMREDGREEGGENKERL